MKTYYLRLYDETDDWHENAARVPDLERHIAEEFEDYEICQYIEVFSDRDNTNLITAFVRPA